MPPLSSDGEGPALLLATVKAAAAIGLLSVLAAQWLSSGAFDQASLTRLAAEAVREPATTGSILKAANGQKLDPCAAPRRL